jgi:hypothetical protein
MKKVILLAFAICVCTFTLSNQLFAQTQEVKKKKSPMAFYFSWGYNQEWYSRSDVHVTQKNLGNEYTLENVKAHDHKGWDQHFLQQELTIPQYNWRIGCYFNEKQDLGFELNFDHTKYIIAQGQQVQVNGKLDGKNVDLAVSFNSANGFYYYLNNGANFLLFNVVKRVGLYHTDNNYLRIDLTGKAGVGPVVPHVENSLFGKANNPHFQVGGWNAGLETALRVTIMRYGFVEFSQKIDHARYSNLKIYEGTAKQHFNTYELILSAGCIFPTTEHHPMFGDEAPTKVEGGTSK